MPYRDSCVLSAETALLASIAGLRRSEVYSDLKIECQGVVFKTHRAIVCTQSNRLASMVDGDWIEASAGTINLGDEDRDIVAKMIDFLYRSRYNDNREADEGNVPNQPSFALPGQPSAPGSLYIIKGPLITNAKVYILGNKYDIPSLKEMAARKFREVVKDRWNGDDFIESAELTYDNIDNKEDALKSVVVEAAHSNIQQLLRNPEFVNLLEFNGSIATDILKVALDFCRCGASCPYENRIRYSPGL